MHLNSRHFLCIYKKSWIYIGYYYIKTTRYLKNSNVKLDIEFRTTWVIFVIVLMYSFIFIFMIIIDVFPDVTRFVYPYTYKVMLCIYVMQFSTNCYIYAFSTQFKDVFIHAYNEWKGFFCNFAYDNDSQYPIFEFDL